ncbi:MAG TPA: winged helix DNA-binding domain-containing protein [Anaerolineales bacterium]
MTSLDIARLRLHNQHLSTTTFKSPSEVVSYLGAVQAQDYAGAKWAIGLRTNGLTETDIDRAFADGSILRTHLLRPTWHFVAPADIRWMLELTAPRVHAANAFMYRKLELDKPIIKKSYTVLEKALQGNQHLTRRELASIFNKAGIPADGLRLGYFMMSAELDRVICSGPRKGKQFTYALLEERVPKTKSLMHDEALAELTRRYFASRGPATLRDFAWWSGLTIPDAKKGIEMVKPQFVNHIRESQTYWFANSQSLLPLREKYPKAHLLPNYDEYFIGFKDRSAIGEVMRRSEAGANRPALNAHIVFIDGQIVGGWRRTLKKDIVTVELNLLKNLTKVEKRAVTEAAIEYGKFLGLPVALANLNS